LVGKPMIFIMLKVKTVYIHDLGVKLLFVPPGSGADPITTSGITNRQLEARASIKQLELVANKPHIHLLSGTHFRPPQRR
jgi:hypothetical protein